MEPYDFSKQLREVLHSELFFGGYRQKAWVAPAIILTGYHR